MTASLGMLGGMMGEFLLTAMLKNQGWRLTHYGAGCLGAVLALIIFCALMNEQRHPVKSLESYLLPDFETGYRGLKQLLKQPAP